MPKHKYAENSEEWKELLHDFLNFEESGFKPFGPNIGGVDHFRSRGDFWEKTVRTKDAFRSLANRVAMKACAMLPNSTLEKYGYDKTLDKVTDDEAKSGKPSPDKKADNSKDNNKTLASVDTNMEEVVALADEDHGSRLEQILLGYKPAQMMKPYILRSLELILHNLAMMFGCLSTVVCHLPQINFFSPLVSEVALRIWERIDSKSIWLLDASSTTISSSSSVASSTSMSLTSEATSSFSPATP